MVASTKRRKGFSLLEMLVVLAILAFLSVIGFGALKRSRQAAEQAVCQRRLQQTGMAIIQFSQENGSRYPGPLPGNHGALYLRSGNTLAGYLAPYFNLPQPGAGERLVADIMECSAARRAILRQGGRRQDAIYYNAPTTTLPEGTFRPFGYTASGVTPTEPLSMNALGAKGVLARVVLLTETDRFYSPALASNLNAPWEIVHGTGRNVLFADGHIEFRISL